MSESWEWEITLQLTFVGLNEVPPHHPSCGVVREWEVDVLIKQLFEVFLRSLLRLRGATDDSDPSLMIYKLLAPLFESFLDPCWVRRVSLRLLLLTFFLFLLGWESLLTLIDVDDTWLILFSSTHDQSYKLLLFLLGRELSVNVVWTKIIESGVGLAETCSHHHGLTCARRAVE